MHGNKGMFGLKVLFVTRGHVLIGRSYGEDSELTEAYDKELWQFGMP